MNSKEKIILIVLGLLIVLYACFSSPAKVAVNADGAPSDLLNKFRASVQGKRFWANQLKALDRELSFLLSEPQRWAELDQLIRYTDRKLNKMHQEHPELMPSPAERRAEALRARADAIEGTEISARLEKYRMERIRELRWLRPKIESRSK